MCSMLHNDNQRRYLSTDTARSVCDSSKPNAPCQQCDKNNPIFMTKEEKNIEILLAIDNSRPASDKFHEKWTM
eukprot:scaffold451304_cov17-Prasinocladus_malaysianus.AAC.2